MPVWGKFNAIISMSKKHMSFVSTFIVLITDQHFPQTPITDHYVPKHHSLTIIVPRDQSPIASKTITNQLCSQRPN